MGKFKVTIFLFLVILSTKYAGAIADEELSSVLLDSDFSDLRTGLLMDTVTGLEAVSVNFWGNQGIIHYYDAEGDIYHDFEPCQHGSMCLPINWTGSSEEYFILSANPDEGGLFDGRGRCVVKFPADGHPDMCNAVLDVTGDCRDEIVVWDPFELWVYTQHDNPRECRLYKPRRNSLYNYSNYQASVSLPAWSTDR